MKNYLLANFRLHHFKSLGYMKLGNIRKSMQIRKPFVQKIKKLFPLQILGKITLPQIVFFFFQFPIFVFVFVQYLTQPTVQLCTHSTAVPTEYCEAHGEVDHEGKRVPGLLHLLGPHHNLQENIKNLPLPLYIKISVGYI